MTAEEYFAADGLSATAIKAGRESMRMMHYTIHNSKPETPAMRRGKLIHEAVLEPERIESWCIFEGKDWRPAGAKAFRAAHTGETCVLESELTEIDAIKQSVWSNRHAARLIGSVRYEVPLFWDDRIYGKAKAKLDGLGTGLLLDLKTTTGALDDRAIERQAWNMGYHIQLGWYHEAAIRNGHDIPPDEVYIIWVKQSADLDCRVVRVDEKLLLDGKREAIEIARAYRVHEDLGSFPGVSGDIETLHAPAWTQSGEVDLGGIDDE
jgi:hypothetical protein